MYLTQDDDDATKAHHLNGDSSRLRATLSMIVAVEIGCSRGTCRTLFSVSMTGWAVEQGDVVGSGRVIEGNATDAGTSGLTPSCICRTEGLGVKTEAST